MTIEQLNEFKFFTKKSSNKKPQHKMKDGYAMFDFEGFDKVYITKYKKGDGFHNKIGKFRMFLKAKAHTISTDHENVELAIKSLVRETNKLISTAKSGKTETSPADIQGLTVRMFNIRRIEKDLNR